MHKPRQSSHCLSFLMAFALVFATAFWAMGKGSSSRSSSSSSRSSSSSSGKLYNKPSSSSSSSSSKPSTSTSNSYVRPATKAAPTTTTSSSGSSKPSTPVFTPKRAGAAPPLTATAKGNRFDAATTQTIKQQRAAESKAAYDANKSKFKPAPVPLPSASNPALKSKETVKSNPVFKNTKTYAPVNYRDVHTRRDRYYSGWNMPTYGYHMAPSYGAFDSTFLWWMLLNDASYGYHHRDNAEYRAFREDAKELAKTNKELEAKLAEHDAKIAQMQTANVPVNAGYVPPKFAEDPMAMLSDDAIKELPVEKPTIRIATGVPGGRYNEFGENLKKAAGDKFNVVLVTTSGSGENLTKLKNNEVDAAIVQSDADFIQHEVNGGYVSKTGISRALAYSEYVMLMVGKDSPIKSVQDLKAGNTVYVGPQGSGSGITWQGLVLQNAQYKDVKVENSDYDSAMEKVKKDPTSAMLFVAGSNAPILERASRSGQLRLVPVDDDNLVKIKDDKGNEVYDSLLVTSNAYPGLQEDGKELETLSVDAEWNLSDAWVKKYGDDADEVVSATVIDVISNMHMKDLEAEAKNAAANESSGGGAGKVLLWIVIALAVIGAGYWLLCVKQWGYQSSRPV